MAVSKDRIFQIVAKEADLDQASLLPDATFEELDISSLDLASAMFALEDELGIDVDPDNISPGATLSEFADYVSSLPSK